MQQHLAGREVLVGVTLQPLALPALTVLAPNTELHHLYDGRQELFLRNRARLRPS